MEHEKHMMKEKGMSEMMKKKMMADEEMNDKKHKMEKGKTPEMHSNVHESTITKNVYPRDLETTD